MIIAINEFLTVRITEIQSGVVVEIFPSKMVGQPQACLATARTTNDMGEFYNKHCAVDKIAKPE